MLCHNHLEILDESDTSYQKFTTYKNIKDSKKIFLKAFTLINIISIVLCLFIDYSTNKNVTWSLLVAVSNVYLIFMLRVSLSKSRLSSKIVGLSFFDNSISCWYWVLINDYHWALDIFLPFALITQTITVIVIIFSRRSKWRDYLSFFNSDTISKHSNNIINILRVTNTTWAVTACFFFGVITFIAFAVFTPKDLKERNFKKISYIKKSHNSN